VIGIWCVGLALFAIDLGRAAGHMLWVTFAVGGCLAWSMLAVRRPRFAALTSLTPPTETAGSTVSAEQNIDYPLSTDPVSVEARLDAI
jgi:hypothetical protein